MPNRRRPFTALLSAWSLAASLSLTSFIAATPLTAHAAAPQQKTQVPGYYRLAVGQFEVTALFDGIFELDPKLLKNASEGDVQKLLARMFQRGPKVQTAVNAYLVNTGSKLLLIDTGAAGLFGPGLGQVLSNLKAAGHQPEQVDAVLLTHLHGDHANGLLQADGQPAFPNADIWTAQSEADFWLKADLAKVPEKAQPFFKMAQDAVAPYAKAGKLKTFSGQQEIFPGIHTLPAPGHTPGHTAFNLKSGEQSLLIWGDIVHNAAVQFTKPAVSIEFDVDQKLAVSTRKAFFAKVAKEQSLVAGAHLAFPGIGHVRADSKGYSWVPIEFGTVVKK